MNVLIEGLASTDSFIWNFFPNIEDFKEKRDKLAGNLLRITKKQRSHYIKSDLTNLPFPDNTFQWFYAHIYSSYTTTD